MSLNQSSTNSQALTPLTIVVLISGSGSNLQSIIDRIEKKKLNAKILAVISNNKDAYGLERAQKANIPTQIIDHQLYPTRLEFDQVLAQCIHQYQPELIVLAGFMRILSEQFVQQFHPKMINIHPSLLPKHKGLHTHQRVLDAGETAHGLTIHFVSPTLDDGPIILQKTVAVLNDDNEQSLANRVLQQEHKAYPQVIQWFAEQRVQLLSNDQVIIKNLDH